MIKLNRVLHHYKNSTAVEVDALQIQSGEEWLLLGNSGTGKSTLLHIISGLLKPSQGDVFIDNKPIYELSGVERDQFRARHIGIIFQKPHLVGSMTVSENLMLSQYLAAYSIDKNRVHTVLESLGIAEKKNAYPRELSQGQAQRVSIARAVINMPPIIVADEPTSSLDDTNASIVIELLKKQTAGYNATIIVATHDQRVRDSFTNTYYLS